jgi:DNA-binding protein H-NS
MTDEPSLSPDTEDLETLLRKRARLEAEIAELKQVEREAALFKIRTLMQIHGLTLADIDPQRASARQTAISKVVPKYRDPNSGQVWSGRGRAPRWMQGRAKEDFLIPS